MINNSNNTAGRISLVKTKGVILASVIVGALALPLITQAAQPPTKEHPRYKLIDLGTFGGPFSTVGGETESVNNHRITV